MPKDYAPPGERRKAVRRKSGNSTLPGWVWLFAGLSIGMAGAAFYYIGRPLNNSRQDAPVADVEATKTGKATAADKGKKGPLELPPKEKARFTFYEILPNQETVIPRESFTVKTAPDAVPVAVTGELYFIQVASYRGKDEAERQRAALALIGAEAQIEKVTINNKDTYYRVRIGPDKSLTHAQGLMARLEENGITAMLVKVKN